MVKVLKRALVSYSLKSRAPPPFKHYYTTLLINVTIVAIHVAFI
jgi:hypothetical protein